MQSNPYKIKCFYNVYKDLAFHPPTVFMIKNVDQQVIRKSSAVTGASPAIKDKFSKEELVFKIQIYTV